MAKLIFDGLTFEQAKTLADWSSCQGEQSCEIWFEHRNVPIPYTNVIKKGWEKIDKANETVTIECHSPK